MTDMLLSLVCCNRFSIAYLSPLFDGTSFEAHLIPKTSALPVCPDPPDCRNRCSDSVTEHNNCTKRCEVEFEAAFPCRREGTALGSANGLTRLTVG